jgi:hypothetical protein
MIQILCFLAFRGRLLTNKLFVQKMKKRVGVEMTSYVKPFLQFIRSFTIGLNLGNQIVEVTSYMTHII